MRRCVRANQVCYIPVIKAPRRSFLCTYSFETAFIFETSPKSFHRCHKRPLIIVQCARLLPTSRPGSFRYPNKTRPYLIRAPRKMHRKLHRWKEGVERYRSVPILLMFGSPKVRDHPCSRLETRIITPPLSMMLEYLVPVKNAKQRFQTVPKS